MDKKEAEDGRKQRRDQEKEVMQEAQREKEGWVKDGKDDRRRTRRRKMKQRYRGGMNNNNTKRRRKCGGRMEG